MIDNDIEILLSVIRLHYGRKVTLEKCKEELQELIQAINKNNFEKAIYRKRKSGFYNRV